MELKALRTFYVDMRNRYIFQGDWSQLDFKMEGEGGGAGSIDMISVWSFLGRI